MLGLFWLVFLFVYFAFARGIYLRMHTRRARVITVVVAILILIGDSLVGNTYLYVACLNGAGTRVFKTIVLPDKYFDDRGYGGKKSFGPELRNKYRITGYRTEKIGLGVEKAVDWIFHPLTGERLAEFTTYRYWGGWMSQIAYHVSANGCSEDLMKRGITDEQRASGITDTYDAIRPASERPGSPVLILPEDPFGPRRPPFPRFLKGKRQSS